jgi:hypothetical protein
MHMQPWSRKLSCCCAECINPSRTDPPGSDCAFHRRLGEWKLWSLTQLTRPEEVLQIRSFVDGLTDQCQSKPRIVALHVPEGYDDTGDYWLMLVTSVETVANHQGVQDSVEQKVKKGDSMLFGHFLERVPWYKDNQRGRSYYVPGEEVRMDTRHCMRDAGIIEDQFNSGKMTGSQLKTLGAEILNDKRYTLKAVAHDTIMDLIEPGAFPNADDDVVM